MKKAKVNRTKINGGLLYVGNYSTEEISEERYGRGDGISLTIQDAELTPRKAAEMMHKGELVDKVHGYYSKGIETEFDGFDKLSKVEKLMAVAKLKSELDTKISKQQADLQKAQAQKVETPVDAGTKVDE